MVNRLHTYIVLLLALVLASCETVREQDTCIEMAPVALDRTMLLVEFTGLQCSNCPDAAAEAARLLDRYPDNLIVVAMHPKANPFTAAMPAFDYTCPAADRYYADWGGTASTPFPTGVLAFLPFDGTYFVPYTNWEKRLLEAPALLSQKPVAETRYWLVEDSITGMQLMPNNQWNDHYVHRHLLRAELSEEERALFPANCAELAPKADSAHCHIIAISLDADGRFVQAKKQ